MQSFKTYLRLLPLLAAVALMMEAAALLVSSSSSIGTTVVVHILVTMAFYRAILLNESYSIRGTPYATEKRAANLPFLPFAGRILLFFLPLAAVFASAIVALPTPTEHENQTAARALLALGMTTLVFPFWGALAGTMLPAAATGGDSSFRSALRRGRQTYWRTVGRLFAGPVLFQASVLVLVVTAVPRMPIFATDNPPIWMTLVVSTLGTTIAFFTPLLTSTALSMAYRVAEFEA
ncbi:hypothetical protein [Jannaschia aquimarina]|uniref:Uncharacterized protein n=1 Tax=Jannaschia aquimarina TaxID=935700 RepID=A0A0D1D8Y3_9RHOB|nr:hypothetical protein [Jannaschia aquimarina]KIT16348.1 hypothetical protein jaqu_19440 [Jannaschia aquimarina]SNT25808.1 hypothetical protein SAMN05421775_10941 [Jannaschia aquimarina]